MIYCRMFGWVKQSVMLMAGIEWFFGCRLCRRCRNHKINYGLCFNDWELLNGLGDWETTFYRRILGEEEIYLKKIIIKVDKSAIRLIRNPELHKRSDHFDVWRTLSIHSGKIQRCSFQSELHWNGKSKGREMHYGLWGWGILKSVSWVLNYKIIVFAIENSIK